MHGKNDARAFSHRQLGITAKLDRVAEPLFGTDQQGLADDPLLAAPERLVMAPRPRNIGALEAPFVEGPAVVKAPQLQCSEPLIPMSVEMIGVDGNGMVKACQRFLDTPDIVQGEPTIIPGAGDTWVRRETPVEAREGLLWEAEMLQRDAVIVPGLDISGFGRKRGGETHECFFMTLKRLKRETGNIERLACAGIDSERIVDPFQRFLIAPLLETNDAQEIARHKGGSLCGLAIKPFRRRQISRPMEGGGPTAQGLLIHRWSHLVHRIDQHGVVHAIIAAGRHRAIDLRSAGNGGASLGPPRLLRITY